MQKSAAYAVGNVVYAVPCGHILAIHKAAGYMPAGGKVGGTVSSGDMLPIGRTA